MFVTAIHRKRPEPNKSRSIRVLCGGDGEILNLLAPLGASRPVGVSNRPFSRLAETSSGSPSAPIKKAPASGVFFIGGDGGLPVMYTTASSPSDVNIIPQITL